MYRPRRSALTPVGLALCLVVSACGDGGTVRQPPESDDVTTMVLDPPGSTLDQGLVSSTTPPAPAATTSAPSSLADLDLSYDADRLAADETFFRSFGAPGADWGYWFESLEEMAAGSHAIIVGTVVGNVEGPSFPAEHLVDDSLEEGEGESAFTITGYEVRVESVLAGALPVGDSQVLVNPGGPPLPTGEHGPVVLFLWWGGQAYLDGWANESAEMEEWTRRTYRLSSPQGAFIAGPDGAYNVGTTHAEGYLDDDPTKLADPVAEEVRRISLTDLVDLVQGYRTLSVPDSSPD